MFIFHVGIISSWGRGGKWIYLMAKISQNFIVFGRFWFEKLSDLKNLFSPDLPIPYAIMMHKRFYFNHSNPESQAGFCILGQNHPFFDLNHKRLCHSPTFDLRAKLYMVSCTPWLVVLILQPNSKSLPKSYSAIRPILTSNTLKCPGALFGLKCL